MQCLLSQSRSLVWLREGDTINHSSFPSYVVLYNKKVNLDRTSGCSKVGMRLLLLAKCLEGLGGGCVCNSHKSLDQKEPETHHKRLHNPRERETEEKQQRVG